MSDKVSPSPENATPEVQNYEKPCMNIFPDYVDTTLQQTAVIPGSTFWNE